MATHLSANDNPEASGTSTTSHLETTRVVFGKDNAVKMEVIVARNAKERLDTCLDKTGPSVTLSVTDIKESISEMRSRGVRIRYITEINKENLELSKELSELVEMKHLDGVRGNFALNEKEYIATASLLERSGSALQLLYSSVSAIVEQQAYLFEILWNKATPARTRIAELESGTYCQTETKVIRGHEEVLKLVYAFFGRSTNSFLRASSDGRQPDNPQQSVEYMQGLLKKNPNLKIQIITDIQKENLDYNRKVAALGISIKHLDGNKIAFAVSQDEYIAVRLSTVEERRRTGAELPSEIIWSNREDFVIQANQIFEMMWSMAMPSDLRFNQLELGIEPEQTRLLDDITDAYKVGASLSAEAREEVLMILTSHRTIVRNAERFGILGERQKEKKLKVRILTPTLDPEAMKIIPDAEWRNTEPMKVSILIYDREKMFITQYADSDANTTERAVRSNIYTTNRQTIAGMVSVFEALWRESELREEEVRMHKEISKSLEKEERSRRQAQLLQDILTHDLRNYNQVAKLSAELLKEKLASTGDSEGEDLADSLLDSIDGSTLLVERGKKLGRILAEENPLLVPMDLAASLKRALDLVKLANPEKFLKEDARFPQDSPPGTVHVIADDLLDEVFTNVFSNAAKYTEGRIVPIRMDVTAVGDYWKVSISDEGIGIPKSMQDKVFERYVAGARGSGLGLSIIHALVVSRYGGKAFVSSGLTEDQRGTTIEIWLRRGDKSK